MDAMVLWLIVSPFVLLASGGLALVVIAMLAARRKFVSALTIAGIDVLVFVAANYIDTPSGGDLERVLVGSLVVAVTWLIASAVGFYILRQDGRTAR